MDEEIDGSFNDDLSSNECKESFNHAKCYLEPLIVTSVTVMVFLGNTVNIVALSTEKMLRNKHGYFLLSLAISDLCTSLASAVSIHSSITREWTLPHVLCEITGFTQVCLTEVSLTMVVGMSIERYIAVFYPLQIRRWLTKKRCFLSIVCSWVCLFSLNLLLCFNRYIDVEYDEDLFACVPDTGTDETVLLIISYNVIEIPALFIVSYVSLRLVAHIWWKGRRRTSRHGNTISNSQHQHTTSTLKVICIITVTFYVTWIPFIVLRLHHVSDKEESPGDETSHWAEFSTYWLMISSGFTNVFVYCLLHEKFRTHLKALCKRTTTSCVKALKRCACSDDPDASLAGGSPGRDNQPSGQISINRETITTML